MNPVTTEQEACSLIEQHKYRVAGIAAKYTDSVADAEDLIQRIWTQAFKNLSSRDPSVPVEGWLVALAANEGRYWHRTQSNRWKFLSRAAGFLQFEADQRRGELEAIEERVVRRVWEAVDRLPELQRSVVKLRFHVGLSTKETAAAVGRAEGTVKASLRQGVRKLRSELSDLHEYWMSGDL